MRGGLQSVRAARNQDDLPAAGGAFPGYGAGIPGPTALGTAGASATVRRSDQAAPAYRSDLPLSANWFIDPVNGSDVAAGTTSATSLATLAELRRRWWSAEITQNTTVTILGNIPASDSNAFNTRIQLGKRVTFLGTLGATTGFGGAAIDNTLFTGAVTAYTAGSATPAADDIELNDASIPVSYTASGLLAKGVIFRRTVTATRHWYALKDLGGKTIRITCPMNATGPANFSSNPLTAGDAYSAFAMWTMPPQTFGFADTSGVTMDTLHAIEATGSPNEGNGARGYAPLRSRIYFGTRVGFALTCGSSITNCLFNPGTDVSLEFIGMVPPQMIGGGAIGNGTNRMVIFGYTGIGGAFSCQGMRIEVNDQSLLSIEAGLAVHDTTLSAIHVLGGGYIGASAAAGISGKGNTNKLLLCDVGGRFYYGFNAPLPPFVAGSTSDANPISVGATSYAVALLPPVAETLIQAITVAGPGGPYTMVGKFSAVSGNAGAPSTVFMDDNSNGTGAPNFLRYPTSARLITRLRLCAPVGTGAHPPTATLYKNGVATLMTCTLGAGVGAGTNVVDSAHPILFADGDTFDVVLTQPTASEGPSYFTAVLEGPA